jgi:hypothetical protein
MMKRGGFSRERARLAASYANRPRSAAIIAALLLSVLAGCARGRQERPTDGAAVATADSLANGVPVALARKSGEWSEMWRKADSGFALDSLVRKGREAAHLGADVRPLEQSVASDVDSTVLREIMGELSPSGRQVLIPDIYRELPDSEVDNPAGGEADEAAILIDYERRTCDMFLVHGTPYTFDWGCWVDSTHFALAGSESDDADSCFGFLWLYSAAEHSVTTWNTRPVALALRDAYYAASQERLMARCRQWKAARQNRSSGEQKALGK